jgi:ParB/RepB/Spo0J family partition protein
VAKRDLSAIAASAGADLRPLHKGRGLAGLMSGGAALENARRLPLEQIEINPSQARQQFDQAALDELTESVREHGVLQPIGVQRLGDRYRIVFGERRYRAAKALELPDIPAIVYEDLSEADAAIFTALENLQREDLSYTDEARQYLRLSEVLGSPATALAEVLHVDHNRISRLLRIARESPALLAALDAGTITFREAFETVRKRNGAEDEAADAEISHGEKSERTPRAEMPQPGTPPAPWRALEAAYRPLKRIQPDAIPLAERDQWVAQLQDLRTYVTELLAALEAVPDEEA